MQYFVESGSIVRKIWGKSDTILFIFAGAAAEFALNKAVDWLYFTGRLPADPIGRLFSTVSYARSIVFSTSEAANKAIDTISSIHKGVEKSRGYSIPDWAYRDVLFMLIYYSIAAHELLEKKLDPSEKEEVYNVFYRVGDRMGLKELPRNYREWLHVRTAHLENDLDNSDFTLDLFNQYKKQLGNTRYRILIEAQKLVVPRIVKNYMGFGNFKWLAPTVPIYKMSSRLRLDSFIKTFLLPREYREQINALNVVNE